MELHGDGLVPGMGGGWDTVVVVEDGILGSTEDRVVLNVTCRRGDIDQGHASVGVSATVAAGRALAGWVPVETSEGSVTVLDLSGEDFDFGTTEIVDEVVTVKEETGLGDEHHFATIQMPADHLGVTVEDNAHIVEIARSADLDGNDESEGSIASIDDCSGLGDWDWFRSSWDFKGGGIALVEDIDSVVGEDEAELETGVGVEGDETAGGETEVVALGDGGWEWVVLGLGSRDGSSPFDDDVSMSGHGDRGRGEGKVLGVVNGSVEGLGSKDVGVHEGAGEETTVAAGAPGSLIGDVVFATLLDAVGVHKGCLPVLPGGNSREGAEDGLAGVKVHVVVEDLVALSAAA